MQRAFLFQSWKLYCNASQSEDVAKPLGKPFQNIPIIVLLLSIDLEWGLDMCIMKIFPRWPGHASLLSTNHQGGIKNPRLESWSPSIIFLSAKWKYWLDFWSLSNLERYLCTFYSEKPVLSCAAAHYPSIFAVTSAHTFWFLSEEAGGGRATLARGMQHYCWSGMVHGHLCAGSPNWVLIIRTAGHSKGNSEGSNYHFIWAPRPE